MNPIGSISVVERDDIKSSLAPFCIARDYKVQYPEVVKIALGELYVEYNAAFKPLVAANHEWESDYRFVIGQDCNPLNFAVQIDMVGLSDEFLQRVVGMPEAEVRETFRRSIFELENSIAMYQTLERLFAKGGESGFKTGWRAALDDLRRRFGKPIALLAVTDQKHAAMMTSEFGKDPGELMANEEVLELSGFDKFFSPEEFQQHMTVNGGECKYLLFVRASDPITKLKKPDETVESPLIANPLTRQLIKKNALTFNIDNPSWSIGDAHRRINDTKWYMPTLGMAFPIGAETDLFYPEGNHRLSEQFSAFLNSVGVNPGEIGSGRQALRFKPAQGTYGCYGHLRGPITDGVLRSKLRRELRRRGPYMVQPELEASVIGDKYTFIDRVFYAYIKDKPTFVGGFRSLLPLDSPEAKSGRNHGSKFTILAEIF